MKDYKLIFLGTTHGFIDDFKKEKEIINEINPKLVLSESLENKELKSKKDFESFIKIKQHSEITSFKEVEKLVKYCYSKKIPLIGIDFKNYGFEGELIKIINSQKQPTKKQEKRIDKILKKREKRHIKIIKDFTKKTSKPILITLGSWHLRKDSLIRKKFRGAKIIYLVNKKGEMILEPTKEGVKYEETKI